MFLKKKRFRRQIEQIFKKVRSLKGVCYKPYWDVRHIQYPKEWFAKAIVVPFEDTEIFVPNGYHEILTYLFKDYMTPPPAHSRTGHHRFYYPPYSIQSESRRDNQDCGGQIKGK